MLKWNRTLVILTEKRFEYGKHVFENDYGFCRGDGCHDNRVFGGWGKIAKATTDAATRTTSGATAGRKNFGGIGK